jgi:hypothetical protein
MANRILAKAVATIALLLPSHAGAADHIQAFATLKGKCEKLVLAGADMSARCGNIVSQTAYHSGRTGFYVTVGDHVVTFSGIEGAKPDADTQLQSVDTVLLNFGPDKAKPAVKTATGGCAYSNPYLGPMTISCDAVDDGGEAYLLQFRTDGTPPTIRTFEAEPAVRVSEPTAKKGYFEVGPWTGELIEGRHELDSKCVMSMPVEGGWQILAEAGTEYFGIAISNEKWHFKVGDKFPGDVVFGDVPYPNLMIEALSENVVALRSFQPDYDLEIDGYMSFFENASELTLQFGQQQFAAKLPQVRAAMGALIHCAWPGYEPESGDGKISLADGVPIVLHGRLTTLTALAATTASERDERFPALTLGTLADFACATSSDPWCQPETNEHALHLVLDEAQMVDFKRLRNRAVFVRGEPFHAINGNHHTDVLLSVTEISENFISNELVGAIQTTPPALEGSVSTSTGPSAVVATKQTEQAAKASRDILGGRLKTYLAGRELEIRASNQGTSGTWYRVVLPVEDTEAAKNACAEIIARGADCLPAGG